MKFNFFVELNNYSFVFVGTDEPTKSKSVRYNRLRPQKKSQSHPMYLSSAASSNACGLGRGTSCAQELGNQQTCGLKSSKSMYDENCNKNCRWDVCIEDSESEFEDDGRTPGVFYGYSSAEDSTDFGKLVAATLRLYLFLLVD